MRSNQEDITPWRCKCSIVQFSTGVRVLCERFSRDAPLSSVHLKPRGAVDLPSLNMINWTVRVRIIRGTFLTKSKMIH